MNSTLKGTVSALAFALYPNQGAAQTVLQDKVTLDRNNRRVDVAAAYTEVLYSVQKSLAYYLAGTARAIKTGTRADDDDAQEAYVEAIIASVEQTGQPPIADDEFEIADFPYTQAASFDIAFRYCGGMLLSYFDTTTFKSGLTAQEIQRAPRLQASRENRGHNAQGLYMLRTDADVRTLEGLEGQSRSYPECFDEFAGVASVDDPDPARTPAPLPNGTLISLQKASASWRVVDTLTMGVERQKEACSGEQVGYGINSVRDVFQDKDARGKSIGGIEDRTFSDWREVSDGCNDPALIKQYSVEKCAEDEGGGIRRYQYFLKQERHPEDPYKTIWRPADEHGNPVGDDYVMTLDLEIGQCSGTTPPTKTLDPVRDEWFTETRGACTTAYPAYPTILSGTYSEERWRHEKIFESPDFGYTVDQITYTDWAVVQDSCHAIIVTDRTETRSIGCPSGWGGSKIETRSVRNTRTDFANPAETDPVTTVGLTGWTESTNTCQPPPPPPPPACRWYEARDCPSTGGGGEASNVNGGDGPDIGFDTTGDGRANFTSKAEAERAGVTTGGRTVSNTDDVAATREGRVDPNPSVSEGGEGDGGKIICTAMNAAYGFGSYRQAIWLAHAKQNMTTNHQTGYHLMAMPLIRIAYGSDTHLARIVRYSIEHMARERTADIRAEMRGGKRRTLGRAYRNILEPMCYIRGWVAGGRVVEEITQVPVIAAAMRQNTILSNGVTS